MKKLLFVYNADAGVANAIKDSLKKSLTPKKYECALCQITYGVAFMKPEWKKFIQSLPYEIEFLHRDEFTKQYGTQYKLPAIFSFENKKLIELVSVKDIESAGDLSELKEVVSRKLGNDENKKV
jgi:hypothetical protein